MEFPSLYFEQLWNFPHSIGAIDGKHIMIRCLPNSGSSYFNYKGRFSIHLLAVCDAHYKFILADIGCEGRQSDGGVFSRSRFGKAFQHGLLDLPQPSPLSDNMNTNVPYCLVGDEAFPLRSYLMRPFPGRGLSEDRRIFNYPLSRARRTIGNAFGILSARWRLFLQPIHADPDDVVVYTKAALCLHNFLRTKESSANCPPSFGDFQDSDGAFVPSMWRQSAGASGLMPIGQQGSNRHGRSAAETRDCFKAHFTSGEGQVPWQYAHVQSTGNDEEL